MILANFRYNSRNDLTPIALKATNPGAPGRGPVLPASKMDPFGTGLKRNP